MITSRSNVHWEEDMILLRSATIRARGSAAGQVARVWSWLEETLVPAIASAMARRRER